MQDGKITVTPLEKYQTAVYMEKDFCQVSGSRRPTSGLEKFKSVVVKYEGFEGNTWENPYHSDWIEMNKEKKLELLVSWNLYKNVKN